jgi:hypothetical protein
MNARLGVLFDVENFTPPSRKKKKTRTLTRSSSGPDGSHEIPDHYIYICILPTTTAFQKGVRLRSRSMRIE